ncbi:MAG: M48 family metallopeptidase [Spirochaetales bacterium]|nr:M48 family metallopeptidase [Spirochaetales bacterium]
MGKKKKVILTNISPFAWEHPADRATLASLQQIPALDILLQKLLGIVSDKAFRLIALGSAVRVNAYQFPRYHTLLQEVCTTLDTPYLPELYVAENPFMNAGALGYEKPFIILNSSIVEKLTDEEAVAILGHEVGHCISGHALYRTLLILLINLSLYLLQLPISRMVIEAIIAALYEWFRKSELSADRAGLLAVQDPNVSYTLLMKLAGGTKVEQMNIDEFFKQAQEYDEGGDIIDSVFKILVLLRQTHPFPVLRLTELKTWIDRGDYEKTLGGEYIRREDENKEDVVNRLRKAAEQYTEDMKRSKDPLASVLSEPVDNIIKGVNKAVEDIGDFFDNMMKGFDTGRDKEKDENEKEK